MKREFRLEKDGHHFDVPTYATRDAALLAVRKLPPGIRWKIVHRRSRTEREVVASGNTGDTAARSLIDQEGKANEKA